MKRPYLLAFSLSVLAYTGCAFVATAASPTTTTVVTGTGTTLTPAGTTINTNQNFRYQNVKTGAMGSQSQNSMTIDETGKVSTTTAPNTQNANPVRIDETGRVTGGSAVAPANTPARAGTAITGSTTNAR